MPALRVQTGATQDCSDASAPGCVDLKVDEFEILKAAREEDRDSLEISWSHSEGIQSVSVAIATNQDCSGQVAVFEVGHTSTVSMQTIPEGVYYVCAKAEGSGIEASNNGEIKIVVDRTPPVIESLADVFTNTLVVLNPKITDTSAVMTRWESLSGPTTPYNLSSFLFDMGEGNGGVSIYQKGSATSCSMIDDTATTYDGGATIRLYLTDGLNQNYECVYTTEIQGVTYKPIANRTDLGNCPTTLQNSAIIRTIRTEIVPVGKQTDPKSICLNPTGLTSP